MISLFEDRIQPGFHFLGPKAAVRLQALVAEVYSQAVILAIAAGKSIGVRSRECQPRLPERFLREANFRSGRITRAMIARLRYEPRKIPAGLASRSFDDAHPILPDARAAREIPRVPARK